MKSVIRLLKDGYWAFRSSNIRGLAYALRYKRLNAPCIIRGGGKFLNLHLASAGKRLVIADHVEIFINPISRSKQATLTMGEFVSIGRYSIIGCSNEIVIEDNVTLAPHVHITDRNHQYTDITTPICRQPTETPGPIHIKADSWLGFGVQVMPGVTIGRHCVIAAGSVVTKDIPDYSVAAGIPAKVIKRYNISAGQWESVKTAPHSGGGGKRLAYR
jgi:acetyltransferase-like isoleucine patch superfamily enzyme